MAGGSENAKFSEDFMSIVNEYDILHCEKEYSGSSHDSEGIPISQEASMFEVLRDVTQLKEEISATKITILENSHVKELNEIYVSLKEQKEIIEHMTKALQLVAENQLITSKICSAPVAKDALPIPKHLHLKLISVFKNLVCICKNYGSIAKVMAEASEFDIKEMDEELVSRLLVSCCAAEASELDIKEMDEELVSRLLVSCCAAEASELDIKEMDEELLTSLTLGCNNFRMFRRDVGAILTLLTLLGNTNTNVHQLISLMSSVGATSGA